MYIAFQIRFNRPPPHPHPGVMVISLVFQAGDPGSIPAEEESYFRPQFFILSYLCILQQN